MRTWPCGCKRSALFSTISSSGTGVWSTTICGRLAIRTSSASTRFTSTSSFFRNRFQQRLGVPVNLDLFINPCNLALFVNQERGALRTHVLFPVHRFLLPHAVGFDNLVILIADQGKWQCELRFELGVRSCAVHADSEHDDVFLFEPGIQIPEIASFPGAARSVILGVKVQDYFFPAQIPEPDLLAGIGGGGKVRRIVTNL